MGNAKTLKLFELRGKTNRAKSFTRIYKTAIQNEYPELKPDYRRAWRRSTITRIKLRVQRLICRLTM